MLKFTLYLPLNEHFPQMTEGLLAANSVLQGLIEVERSGKRADSILSPVAPVLLSGRIPTSAPMPDPPFVRRLAP